MRKSQLWSFKVVLGNCTTIVWACVTNNLAIWVYKAPDHLHHLSVESESKRGTLPSCAVKNWLLLPWRETTKIKDLERRINKERSLGFKWSLSPGCIIAQTVQEDVSFCILKGKLGQLSTIFVSWHCDICEKTAFIFSQFCKHSVSVSIFCFFVVSFPLRQ